MITRITEGVVSRVLDAMIAQAHPDVLPDPAPKTEKPKRQAVSAEVKKSLIETGQMPNTIPEVIENVPAPIIDRSTVTLEAQSLLRQLKESGVSKEDADSYYKNVVLDGLKAKRIAELDDVDLTTLANRLKDHDMPSALAFLLPQNNVASEVDEV
jgi:hypothetical protein